MPRKPRTPQRPAPRTPTAADHDLAEAAAPLGAQGAEGRGGWEAEVAAALGSVAELGRVGPEGLGLPGAQGGGPREQTQVGPISLGTATGVQNSGPQPAKRSKRKALRTADIPEPDKTDPHPQNFSESAEPRVPEIHSSAQEPVFLGKEQLSTLPPQVKINADGNAVDENGVLLSFKALRDKHVAHEVTVLGKEAETPAEVLKLAALDRRLPLNMRIDAAKNAAPYYDRKKPVAIDGGADPTKPDGPGLPIGVKNLKGLDDAELTALEALLGKAESTVVPDKPDHLH